MFRIFTPPRELILLAVLASSALSTPTHVPPTATVSELGTCTNPAFNPNVYRDSGGGISLNGHNLIVFADTYTTSGGDKNPEQYFVHNSFAYFDSNDPTQLTDFGADGHPALQLGPMANEKTEFSDKGSFAIWPSSSLAAVGGNTALGVFAVVDETSTQNTPLYNTLATVNLTDDGPVTERVVMQLFTTPEPFYGSFSILNGIDGYIYLFAKVKTGLKVARVIDDPNYYTDVTYYTYWDGLKWSKTIPDASDSTTNMLNYTLNPGNDDIVGPDQGDIFFSRYHNTTIAVFMDGWVNGIFHMFYSNKSESVTGPWIQAPDLYITPSPPADATTSYNYAGHAYPSLDPSGETLLLSYTYGGDFTHMARATFR